MRESFSLFLWNKIDPQTKQLRLNYYIRIILNKYYNGTPIWKMIIKDTWLDIKRILTPDKEKIMEEFRDKDWNDINSETTLTSDGVALFSSSNTNINGDTIDNTISAAFIDFISNALD